VDSLGAALFVWGANEARLKERKMREFQTKGQWVLEVLKLEGKVQAFKT